MSVTDTWPPKHPGPASDRDNVTMVSYGMVWYGTRQTIRLGMVSKEDKIKLEPSVATGCVDGSTPMVWYGRGL